MFNPNIPLNTNFLRLQDYYIQIKNDDLLQLLDVDNTINNISNQITWSDYAVEKLWEAEQLAIAEVTSYLTDRYITEQIFEGFNCYNSGSTYYSNSLVSLEETCYNSGTTYQYGDMFSYYNNGFNKIYKVILSGGTSGVTPSYSTTTPSSSAYTYQYVCKQGQFFYANQPIQSYNPDVDYVTGNIVFYNNQFYIALSNIRGVHPAHSLNIELTYGLPSIGSGGAGFIGPVGNLLGQGQYQTVPGTVGAQNVWALYAGQIPNFPFSGSSTYSFSGISPLNTTYWTQGDNRNVQIKNYVINIALFYLHQSINPRQIPDLRKMNYELALHWLKLCNQGKIDANLPERFTLTGFPTIWGSNSKSNNFW